ncbi:hypothetical protein VE04_04662 [Pseudogymnoascus sp. 24MN13]|nr:hypothetical protein VE04_04662 [Pseudogymnoascus sp. 24MN13]
MNEPLRQAERGDGAYWVEANGDNGNPVSQAGRSAVRANGQTNGVFSAESTYLRQPSSEVDTSSQRSEYGGGGSEGASDPEYNDGSQASDDATSRVTESIHTVTGSIGNRSDIALQGVIYRSLAAIQILARGIEVAGEGLGEDAARVVGARVARSLESSAQIGQRGFQRPVARSDEATE